MNKQNFISPEFITEQNEFVTNFQKANEILWEISQMKPESEQNWDVPLDPMNLAESLGNAYLNFWREPERAMKKQIQLLSGIQGIWSELIFGQAGETKPQQKESRRFAHEAWQKNLVLAFLKSVYTFTHAWLDETFSNIEGLNEHDKIVSRLSMRNLLESMNPANFALTNPEIIETTIKERGANLVRGLEMLREDLIRGKGQLLLRQVDYSAFEVGRNVAATPGKVIYENGHFQIIQYQPTTPKVKQKPVLFIPPWINKYYILDLTPEKSFVKWVVDQGYTTFMISWINADETTKEFTWESRLRALREAIEVVKTEADAPDVHLISFCIGGTMTGSLLAKMAEKNDHVVASSTFLTSQFDFEHAGELMAYVSEKSVALIDQFEDQGFIPAESMFNGFNLLRSNDLFWSYVVNNYWLGKTPMAFDLLYWNSDSMRMPIKIQKFYLEQFYLRNAFMKNKLLIGEEIVGVESIKIPTYHLAAVDDHIAPALSVYVAAKAMKNADVRYVLSGSGHIAGVVNPPAQKKYGYWCEGDQNAKDLDAWREHARFNEGSWWLDWKEWLAKFDQIEVDARTPGRVYKPIEDAPGSFVKVRFDV